MLPVAVGGVGVEFVFSSGKGEYFHGLRVEFEVASGDGLSFAVERVDMAVDFHESCEHPCQGDGNGAVFGVLLHPEGLILEGVFMVVEGGEDLEFSLLDTGCLIEGFDDDGFDFVGVAQIDAEASGSPVQGEGV